MFVCCDASSRTQANSVVFDGGTEESVASLSGPELVHPVSSNRCPSDNSGDTASGVAAEGAKALGPTAAAPPAAHVGPLPAGAAKGPTPPAAVSESLEASAGAGAGAFVAEQTETTAVLEDTPRALCWGDGSTPSGEAVPVLLQSPPPAPAPGPAPPAPPALGPAPGCLEVLFCRPGGGRPSNVLFRRRPLGLDFVPGVVPLEVVGASGAARALGVQRGWWVERFGGAELGAERSFAEAEEAVRLLTQELPEREACHGGACTAQ